MTPRRHIAIGTLRRRLIALFGADSRGEPDLARIDAGGAVTAAELFFGVKPATVRRWLRGPTPRHHSSIPATQLAKLYSPDPQTQRREQAKQQAAAAALQELAALPADDRRRQRDPIAAWGRKGWLQEHFVLIVSMPSAGGRRSLRQVTVFRASGSGRKYHELTAGSGRQLVARVTVPTYFHAQLVAGSVMDEVNAARARGSATAWRANQTRIWDASHIHAVDLGKHRRRILRRYPAGPFRGHDGE